MEESNKSMSGNFYPASSAPGYNLLDHPEVLMRQQNLDFDNARRALDSHNNGTRNFGPTTDRLAQENVIAGRHGPSPPPYHEALARHHHYNLAETEPLLAGRRDHSVESFDDSIEESNFEALRNGMKIGSAAFWAGAAGIVYSGCRVMVENVNLNTIELVITGSLVQILLPGLFVSTCLCQRLWPPPPARNNHKIFLVLYAFLYGIQGFCNYVTFHKLNLADAETVLALITITTPLLSLIILKEPLKLWKLIFIPLMMASLIVVVKPPMIFLLFSSDPDSAKEPSTIGMLAGILGVSILGGLANIAISATGSAVNNGLLIFYSGFAGFFLGLLAAKGDPTQRILSPDIVNIPFIDWMLMTSQGLLIVFGTTFFMKSVKCSSPTVAICMTKMTYTVALYTYQAIINQEVPSILTIIGLAVLVTSSLAILAEYSIYRKLPRFIQRCF